MKTNENEAFDKRVLTYDDDTMCYRNDVLEEVARALEAFYIPFGQDTINSFAAFIRDMKR